uniref:RAD51 interacting motif domain-containing protein n=1 Tax=Magallana gigas TaxID=29159 RepID=K1R558_MAGGI
MEDKNITNFRQSSFVQKCGDAEDYGSKKRVDYSQFGIQDEDDDDFAEFTPPASKRIKTSTSKTEAKSKEPKTNKTKEGRADRKSLNRSAPTDEAFESELQLALEMSRSESQEVKEEIPLVECNKENQQQVEVEGEKAEENPDASSNILDKTDMTSDGPSNICDINSKRESNFKPATVMNKSDDEIEVLATDVIEDAKPRRSSATKKVKKQEASKSSVKPVGAKTPSAAKPLAPRPSPVRRPALSSPSTRWNPPGPAKQKNSDATSIQSPTSGLRLGLSRNMKLKPLHPNLKVQH